MGRSSRDSPPATEGAENDRRAEPARPPAAPRPEQPPRPDPAFLTSDPGVEVPLPAAEDEGADFPVPQWHRYEFLALLGTGSMGAVYKARDRQLGRIVALKFIQGDHPHLMQRFLLEAQAQARLDHPNICRVYEAGRVDGRPYIAMQLIQGASLDRLQPELSLHDKVLIIRDAALALHEAHRLGIIHRDIKPTNVPTEKKTQAIVPRRSVRVVGEAMAWLSVVSARVRPGWRKYQGLYGTQARNIRPCAMSSVAMG
jgi:hypothetical protein